MSDELAVIVRAMTHQCMVPALKDFIITIRMSTRYSMVFYKIIFIIQFCYYGSNNVVHNKNQLPLGSSCCLPSS